MGTADRIIRTLLGVFFGYLYFSNLLTGPIGMILLIVGGVFILTSIFSFCPLYTLVGLNTCSKNKSI